MLEKEMKFTGGLKIPPKHGGFYVPVKHIDGCNEIVANIEDAYQDQFGDGSYPNILKSECCKSSFCYADIARASECDSARVGACARYFKAESLKRASSRKLEKMTDLVTRKVLGHDMHFSLKDLYAWREYSKYLVSQGRDLPKYWQDWCIRYLGITDVSTRLNRLEVCVSTSSPMPCTEHEDLIRDGYRYITRSNQIDMNLEDGAFFMKAPTDMQRLRDEHKRQDLQDELGTQIIVEDLIC